MEKFTDAETKINGAMGYSNIRILLPMFSPESLEFFIKGNCINEDVARLEEIKEKYKTAVMKFKKIQLEEKHLVETVESRPISQDLDEFVSEITEEPIFSKNFDDTPYEFKLIELSKSICFQSYINLDYVENLAKSINQNTSDRSIAEFCLSFKYDPSTISYTKTDDKSYLLSSENSGLRFLGSEIKFVDGKDTNFKIKGIPTNAITIFAGFGSPRMNAISANKRIFLSNGFHRAFALYSKGIEFAPFVVINMANPLSEFPDPFLNVPRNFALNATRPTLLKDFMNQDLVVDLRVRRIVTVVKISIDTQEFKVTF